MTRISIALRAGLLLTLVSPAAAFADQPPVTQPAATAVPVAVRDNGLVATWFPPASGKKGPAILVLGGSEGGEEGGKYLGRAVAREGYGVLSLAYFGADGLPPTCRKSRSIFRPRVGLAFRPATGRCQTHRNLRHLGRRRNRFAGRLAPSRIKAVIAAVPSSVVWQGINMRDFASVNRPTAWREAVPYVPYDNGCPVHLDSRPVPAQPRSVRYPGKRHHTGRAHRRIDPAAVVKG